MSGRHCKPAPTWSRRQVLTLAAAAPSILAAARGALAASATGGGEGLQASRRWGVQLYTVRTQMAQDASTTVQRIGAIGYTELEVLQPSLPVVAPLARRDGLTIVSAHVDANAQDPALETFFSQAREHGLRYVVFPYIAPQDRPKDRAGYEAVGARLSALARSASASGLQLCYHNHAFEFATDRDGTRWLDVLMNSTEAAGMQLELDVFWAAIAGADPVALLKRYAGRVPLVHLKDKDPAAAQTLLESQVARTAFVEVGSGALDFPAILSAARNSGVRHFFVEQDQTPGDPIESLRKSFQYLTALK